jgi:hypothetical protein
MYVYVTEQLTLSQIRRKLVEILEQILHTATLTYKMSQKVPEELFAFLVHSQFLIIQRLIFY